MRVLFHYTTSLHIPSIMADGKLRLAESNLKNWLKLGYDNDAYNRGELKLYKPCVWMTTLEEPNVFDLGLHSSADKTEIKITIKKQPYFKKWKDWSRANNIDKEWAQAFERGRKPTTWWISEFEITMKDIVKIENRYTGEVIFENPDFISKL